MSVSFGVSLRATALTQGEYLREGHIQNEFSY